MFLFFFKQINIYIHIHKWKGESIVLLNAKHKVNINKIKYLKIKFYTHMNT